MKLTPMRVQKDAEAVYEVIIDGGIAIVPIDVAYAIVGHKCSAIKKYFRLKNEVLISQVGCSPVWTIR